VSVTIDAYTNGEMFTRKAETETETVTTESFDSYELRKVDRLLVIVTVILSQYRHRSRGSILLLSPCREIYAKVRLVESVNIFYLSLFVSYCLDFAVWHRT
jgi:hypothetical protein